MYSQDTICSDKPLEIRPTRWLITGGCGFIGTSLINNLVEEGGYFIRVVDNLCVGTRKDLARICEFSEIDPGLIQSGAASHAIHPGVSSHCELIVGDICDKELALHATQNIDVLVHLAANTGVELSVKDPEKDCFTNVVGTLNYLEASRHNKVPRFIFASSGAPIGECKPPIHEELAPHPVSPYGASKLAGEGYCSAYYRTYGVETVALRFGNVYGPRSGRKNSVVAKFIRQSKHGEVLEIYGDGQQTRDFIYIDDLIRAIRSAASLSGIAGQVFQIATNSETTIEELIALLLPIMKHIGYTNVQVCYTNPRKGDVIRNFSNTTKARLILGWQAEIGLREGLAKTVEWFFDVPYISGR